MVVKVLGAFCYINNYYQESSFSGFSWPGVHSRKEIFVAVYSYLCQQEKKIIFEKNIGDFQLLEIQKSSFIHLFSIISKLTTNQHITKLFSYEFY